MSSQPPQRPRRNASPRSGPQPMRATLPFTLRQSSPIRGSNGGRRSSPGTASSPTQHWPDNHKKHSRRSPDHRTSPERSPSTPGYKVEKPKAVKASQIRRTSSLDTIYLSGHWPRAETTSSSITCSGPYGPNQKHQSTQTDEVDRKGSSHKRSSSWGSADNLKEVLKNKKSFGGHFWDVAEDGHLGFKNGYSYIGKLKQQLRKQNSRQSVTSNQRASPVHGNHSTAHYSSPSPSSSTSTTSTSTNTTPTAATQTEEPPMTTPRSVLSTAIPVPTLKAPSTSPRIRGSVEGLNKEIETLVLRGFPTEEERHTAEGHRAPAPRMSRTRSVDTQTPAADDSSDNGSRSESRSQSVSPTTFPMDGSRPSSRSSSTGNGEVKIEKVSPAADTETSPDLHFGPKYASSPSHNKSYQLTRCPPDGCERAKPMEDQPRPELIESNPNTLSCPDKRVSFNLKPSNSSAFCSILPDYPQGVLVQKMATVQIKETSCVE